MGLFGFGKKEKDKMKDGLEKTRTGFWGNILNTLTGSKIDDDLYDELEEQLILADVGGDVAMKLLPRGGYLATASCSHFATEELFIKMLRSAAKDAHRQLRQIEVRQQAPDHPILWGVPETNYLKFFLFQVI